MVTIRTIEEAPVFFAKEEIDIPSLFKESTSEAGYHVLDYYGGNFYHGPAVLADSVTEITELTKISCGYVKLGHKYIVYPK